MQPERPERMPSLTQVWLRHKPECRSIGTILRDARAGRLPGVIEGNIPGQLLVTNETSALAAMQKES